MLHEERRVLTDFANLLTAFNLPRVRHTNEVSPGLLVAVYESITETRLPIADRRDRSHGSQVQNLKTLFAAIHDNIFRFEIVGIDIELLRVGHKKSLLDFIQILFGIRHALNFSKPISKENSSSFVSGSDDESSISSGSIPIQSNSVTSSSPTDESPDTTKEHVRIAQKALLCRKHIQRVRTVASPFSHSLKHLQSNRTKLDSDLTPQATKPRDRHVYTSSECTTPRLLNKCGVFSGGNPKMSKNPAPRAVPPLTTLNCNARSAVTSWSGPSKDDSLSFFSEMSSGFTSRRTITVMSPYRKHLQTRRVRACRAQSHCSVKRLDPGLGTRPSATGNSLNRLNASIRSSSDSNISFYEEE